MGAAETGAAVSARRVLSICALQTGVVDEVVVGVAGEADAGVAGAERAAGQGGVAEVGLREGDANGEGKDHVLHLLIIYLLLR